MDCRCYLVIPARLASTRLPRKMLLAETGKPLIQHTYEAALQARLPSGVCIATDSEEIAEAVRSFGGQVRMTDPAAASGTDRVAELARTMPDIDLFVNLQGDEPELGGAAIDMAIQLLQQNPAAHISTLATPIRSRRQWEDPACVKVVFDPQGRALYFSRAPIPYPRQWEDRLLEADPPVFYQHIGLYVYRREVLLDLAKRPPSRLELLERLEQLRALEAGYTILVGVIQYHGCGIDTPEDYRAFVERCRTG
ncbi:MAG: 3-deoxy-manno-octulosonate cytidylyltransferase [Thermoguttaceae bacterium]|nr:3-deoxy-manno-octulosonate cytidylyltransferase [Thermoguttaceae bacterium]MDW8038906.1 3-deoxy-manno-octulosonate cytidylyltransferase [Thermoguttaceae bacterium]